MGKILSILTACVLFCGTAVAGPLLNHADAWTDGNGRTWTGSTHFVDGTGVLEADVEWSVFAPGDFPYVGYSPTTGEFVYTYQVIVDPGSVETNKFQVNMKPSNEANNIGWFNDLPGGIAPVAWAFASADPQNLVSADWTFAGDLIAGTVSAGLAYSSINAPVDWFGFIQDGGQGGIPQGPLPSPGDVIPEPVTVASLLLAAALLATLRRRR